MKRSVPLRLNLNDDQEMNPPNQPIWDAEKDHPETVSKLREALREVKDPEMGLDIIQLGLVRNISIMDNEVVIKMIMTTPFCPFASIMLDAAQKKATSSINMPVKVRLSDEAWDMTMMEEGTGMDWGLYN